MTAAEVQRLTFDTASCAFRLTAPCVGSRRASAAPGGYRPSGPQKPGEAIADAFVAKLSIGPRSPLGTPPRWLRNSGVESPQQKGDSPWTRAHWTDWVTRSPSCRLTSTSRPPRSEEHTSELQSRPHLVCRLLLEKKK